MLTIKVVLKRLGLLSYKLALFPLFLLFKTESSGLKLSSYFIQGLDKEYLKVLSLFPSAPYDQQKGER